MTDQTAQIKVEVFEDEGTNNFIHFLYAIWMANEGNVELQDCFASLDLDIKMNPLAVFGLLMSRRPLDVSRALTLKRILELGAD